MTDIPHDHLGQPDTCPSATSSRFVPITLPASGTKGVLARKVSVAPPTVPRKKPRTSRTGAQSEGNSLN
jgi:hypothetical protein